MNLIEKESERAGHRAQGEVVQSVQVNHVQLLEACNVQYSLSRWHTRVSWLAVLMLISEPEINIMLSFRPAGASETR